LKEIIKKSLLKLFIPIVNKLGYRPLNLKSEVTTAPKNPYTKDELLFTFFSNLKSAGFYPKHIVDIGANHGTWTRQALKAFPASMFSLLEPQHWMKASINDILEKNTMVRFYGMGAGKTNGSFKFTIVDRDDSCTFSYSEEKAKENGFQQITVPVVTINSFINDEQLPVPDLIKIDAEGLDLEVLEGANYFFGKTEVFMVEAGIVNKMFDNSFIKLINYMDTNGYRLFDITDLNRPFHHEVLWLVELVFIKKEGILDSKNWINND
jgi:FkbM family methyltransferase